MPTQSRSWYPFGATRVEQLSALGQADQGWWWVDSVDGAPFEAMSFVPVPEPKTVKNRIHWDVVVDSLDAVVERGATRLPRQAKADTPHVMADPEGNDSCAFVAHD